MLDKYSYLKEELLKCVDAMFAVENIPGCPCEELREKVRNNTFNLWTMLQRIEATIEGISTAIEKGMNQRSKGEREVEKRKQEL